MARLKLHVTPGAREDGLAGWRGDSLRVKVRARAEKGRANEAALRLLAGYLDLPRSRLALVRGATSREKLIEVEGLSADELQALLGRAPP
jgi:uncharacterized protein YggU (UPF0235/DUF167 family)